MAESDQAKVVTAFIEAINRHDVSALAGLMSKDHVFIDSRGNHVAGREAMTVGWQHYFGMFPDYRITVESVDPAGLVVAVFGRASGTYNGRRRLVAENKIVMPAAWKAVVRNGKVKLWQVYADWTDGCRIMEEDRKSDGPA